jgi:hypothetical protein
MERKEVAIGVAVLLAVVAFSAWHDVSTRDQKPTVPQATQTVSGKPTSGAPDGDGVQRNRDERTGPAWSPSDPVGEDGEPLTLGTAVPGAFEPIQAGMGIQAAIDTGFIEPDPDREEVCEGTFWKWKGDLADGFDVIVGEDRQIASLGMSKAGIETAEGISIGNSFGALKETYGDRLQGPERMDYGQAGAFLRDGNNWIGFGMDNEPGRLTDASRIAFIEVTRGERPGLLRDGC